MSKEDIGLIATFLFSNVFILENWFEKIVFGILNPILLAIIFCNILLPACLSIIGCPNSTFRL